MNYLLNPDDIKIKIIEKKPHILGGAVTHMYRVEAKHICTEKVAISDGHTLIKSAVKDAITKLEEKVYFHKVYKNEYNSNFWEEM